MKTNTILRALFSLLVFVMGSLQAWDSDVPSAGLLIVFLVSLAIALPAVAIILPLQQAQFIGVLALSLILLLAARLLSPVDLPGLFLILMPAAMGFILGNVLLQQNSKIE